MKNFTIEIKWAAIFTVASLLWAVIEKLSGLHGAHIGKQPVYSLLFAIPAIFIFFLALRDKKKNFFGGQMSWKQGMISGMILSVFIAVLSPVAIWIAYTVVSPDYFANAVNYYTQTHTMTQTQAELYFTLAAFMKKGVADALSMGVITSAVVALIVQSKKQN